MEPLNLSRYRPWFYAAALYNLVWGAAAIIHPCLLFDILRIPPPRYLPLWQVVGMFVLVYAPAYAWAARRPFQHRHLILIGLLGKGLGPLGFLWAAARGALPPAFAWIILANDLIWWPAFFAFLRDSARAGGGWPALLRGD